MGDVGADQEGGAEVKSDCMCGHAYAIHSTDRAEDFWCLAPACESCVGYDSASKKKRLHAALDAVATELTQVRREQARGRLVIMWAKTGDDQLSVVADVRASDIVIDQNNDYVDVSSSDGTAEYITTKRSWTITTRG